MRTFAADDSATIRKNMLRSRVIAAADRAGLVSPTKIPKELFLEVGYTEAEFNAIPELQRQLPIMETDLR
jgi:hypothetical protein